MFYGIARAVAGSGVVPYGTIGDSRFVLAIVAMVLALVAPTDPPIPALPFFLFATASMLCGMADGAWIGAAMRHLKRPFFQVLHMYLRELFRMEDGTWQMMTQAPPVNARARLIRPHETRNPGERS